MSEEWREEYGHLASRVVNAFGSMIEADWGKFLQLAAQGREIDVTLNAHARIELTELIRKALDKAADIGRGADREESDREGGEIDG